MATNHLSTKEAVSIQRSMSTGPCCGQSLFPWPPGVPQLSLSSNLLLLTDVSLEEAGGVCNNLSKPSHTQDWDMVPKSGRLNLQVGYQTALLPSSLTSIVRGFLSAEPTLRCERWLPVNTQGHNGVWGKEHRADSWEHWVPTVTPLRPLQFSLPVFSPTESNTSFSIPKLWNSQCWLVYP